ncbi:MAG: hypothetical protein ACYCST_11305 [Acidimicrobiales bacterium]
MTKADAKKAADEHRRHLLSCSTDLMAEIDALMADESDGHPVEHPERQVPQALPGSRSRPDAARLANHPHAVGGAAGDSVRGIPSSRPAPLPSATRLAPHRRQDR